MKITKEAVDFIRLLRNNKNLLIQYVLNYIEKRDFLKDIDRLQETLETSISRLSNSLVSATKKFGLDTSELIFDTNSSKDPVSNSGKSEAIRHIEAGITISTCMMLIKYYRYSYADLIEESSFDCESKKKLNCFTANFFDRFELGYITERTSVQIDATVEESQLSNHEILDEKNRYLTVFDSFYVPIILLDRTSNVINFNIAASELFTGIKRAEVLCYNDAVSTSILNEISCKIRDFSVSTEVENCFETTIDTDTEKHYYKVIFKKLNGVDEKLRSTVIMVQDLTEQHTTEANLLDAKVRAEEADKLKTAFLANMSHEIRTPMNAIIGFTELMLNKKYSKNDQDEYLKLIRRSSADLLNIIEDIIDIAKMESKQLKVKYKACKPFEILTDLKAVFSETLRRYGTNDDIELKLNINKEVEDIICYTDGERLKQVISNLLNNAAKFTNKGYIEFGYRVSDNSSLFFFVRDSGLGIPEEMKEKIFERFIQLGGPSSLNTGGAGLGLAICKNIVGLLGGTIWVESKAGVGSDFCFELPLREVPRNVLKNMDMTNTNLKKGYPQWHNKVILIAEDDEINFIFLNEILSKTGAKILHAKDGLKAIDFVETQEKIDLILMDMKMPKLGGIEATRYISTIRPNIPIIAQTAYALDGDRAKCIDAGCCAYIIKPILREKLFQLIAQYMSMENNINDNYLINIKQ